MVEPPKPSWSASFAQARIAQQAPRPGSDQSPRGLARQDFTCGNNNSAAFFEKIAASHSESQRLRMHCREAAASSPARNPAERVKLDHIQRTIDTAKAVGSYSRAFGTYQLGHPEVVPAHLGHLLVPLPTVTAEDASRELTLPGAVEPLPLESIAADGARATEAGKLTPPDDRGGAVVTPDDDEFAGFGESEADEQLEARRSTEHEPPPLVLVEPGGSGGGSPGGVGALQAAPVAKAPAGKRAPSIRSGASRCSDLDDDDDEDDDIEGIWPPKPPLMRFKARMQFTVPFRPKSEESDMKLISSMNRANTERLVSDEQASKELKDMTVGWINQVFAMDITKEFQLEVTFPIVILTMLDAIYTRRVNWREIDFRYQYKHALQKNFAVLERIWHEVNMEKAREFRVESTSLRMESMFASSLQEKLDFCRLMKRWYDVRRNHAEPYDAMLRRWDIVSQSKTWGVPVKFPPWILFDKEEPQRKPETTITDMWRVRSTGPVSILISKGGDAQVIGAKAAGESFEGYQDGDWVGLTKEPGFIRRVKLDTREKFVEKRDKFRVVARAPVPICSAPSREAPQIGQKKYGEFVFGYLDGEWVDLAGEVGYVCILAFSTAERALQICSPEDYKKMPEYKRLIWFLGSPEHQTM